MPNTSTDALGLFPFIDATQQECITDEQAQFFLDNGLLIIRNLLRGQELADMQQQTYPYIERAMHEENAPDTAYAHHEITGKRVPNRVEYIIDKTVAGKALLGHPFILRSVEKLQGRNFIPTWDSVVFKMEGAGAAIAWHRDAGTAHAPDDGTPIFNVDFYLDGSDSTNCLWGIPGSNQWSEEEAWAKNVELNSGLAKGEFYTEGAIPIPMNPGDVILHNILALHGSPPAQSKLRRVVYYEFRPAEVELAKGPHKPEYIPAKQKLLLACLDARANSSYSAGETPFEYRPDAEFIPPAYTPGEELETYRYAHEDYYRKSSE
jgi:phytanoyl-CoA hydroxylase